MVDSVADGVDGDAEDDCVVTPGNMSSAVFGSIAAFDPTLLKD